jgi:hypothetical protein
MCNDVLIFILKSYMCLGCGEPGNQIDTPTCTQPGWLVRARMGWEVNQTRPISLIFSRFDCVPDLGYGPWGLLVHLPTSLSIHFT